MATEFGTASTPSLVKENLIPMSIHLVRAGMDACSLHRCCWISVWHNLPAFDADRVSGLGLH